MSEAVNIQLARLLMENPELPIKVQINGALEYDMEEWYVGEINECEVTEYVEVESLEGIYFGRNNRELLNCTECSIWRKHYHDLYDAFRKTISETITYASPRECYEYAEQKTDEELPDDVLSKLARDEIDSMEWTPCILLKVGYE